MHSYHAYIDESGDDGFKLKDWPERGSSEWFVVGATFVRAIKHSEASQGLHALLDPIEKKRGSPIHFARLSHEERVAVCHGLGKLPIRVLAVCINKRALALGHTLAGERRLYFYAVRFLLERISWLARDNAPTSGGDGKCKLHYAACKGLSYQRMYQYLHLLTAQSTQINWDHIETAAKPDINVPSASIWLRVSDCVATSFARAVELTPQGFCEDRYVRLLKPVVYRRSGKYMSYGIKVFPQEPSPEKARDNRYSWLSLYR